MDFVASPRAAIDGWMATTYHRAPLLEYARFAGYGRAAGPIAVDVMTFGGVNAVAADAPFLVWPYDGMTAVPTQFFGEIPDPLPPGTDRSAGIGYPITLHGVREPRFVSFTLLDEHGVAVPTVQGVDPAGRNWQQFPLRPLRSGVMYQVRTTVSNGGGPKPLAWTFTTATN